MPLGRAVPQHMADMQMGDPTWPVNRIRNMILARVQGVTAVVGGLEFDSSVDLGLKAKLIFRRSSPVIWSSQCSDRAQTAMTSLR